MTILDINKASYFYLTIDTNNLTFVDKQNQIKLDDNIDIVLSLMTATETYKFIESDKLVYLFITKNRKRKGQLSKLIESNLLDKNLVKNYTAEPMLKNDFYRKIETLKRNPNVKLVGEPFIFGEYNEEDLKVFNNTDNWFPWQKEVSSWFFTTTGEIKPARHREILAIFDESGNSGKSSFFKFLYYHRAKDIGRLSYGTSSQLATSLVNIGPKKLYIIDLARSKGKNNT